MNASEICSSLSDSSCALKKSLGLSLKGYSVIFQTFRITHTVRVFQVKCSRYHDAAGAVALVGDAAHATPPFIGQGCNVALEDAAALAHLLLAATGVRACDETAARLVSALPVRTRYSEKIYQNVNAEGNV
jgi:2-polyprenyl-6-methoxyphenol hydroxylase-like FAD-dependent oxidoreductase